MKHFKYDFFLLPDGQVTIHQPFNSNDFKIVKAYTYQEAKWQYGFKLKVIKLPRYKIQQSPL